MPTPNEVESQINGLVSHLVEEGLADDQHFAFQRGGRHNAVEITFPGADFVSGALRDRPYDEIYDALIRERAYNMKLPDGGLIQMMYAFQSGALVRHRLAFFSSPRLDEFQNNPEIYLDDEIYADVVARNIVAFPIRFDYDAGDDVHQELVHPKSHLTLGQYQNCRIPVTAPLTPEHFMDFILRNFYHTAFTQFADNSPSFSGSFAESILRSERGLIHMAIPR